MAAPARRPSRRLALLAALVVGISACTGQATVSPSPAPGGGAAPTATVPATGGAAAPPAGTPPDFTGISLRDSRTKEAFKLSDFKGKVVVMESMAVWCPLCTQQQQEIQRAESAFPAGGVVSISLDVDSREDEAKLQSYAQRQGFPWRFAIAPPDLSRKLSDSFGANVLNPISTPVIILDKDLQPHLLRFGIKSAGELQQEVRKYL